MPSRKKAQTKRTKPPETEIRAPRWRRRKDLRRPEILAAAMDVFAARGFAAARLDEVASRAGVTKGTLYLYFESKEALFKAIVQEQLLPRLAAADERSRAYTGSMATLLLEVINMVADAVIGTRLGLIPKLVIADANNFPELARFYVNEVIARGMGVFTHILERGITQGEFRKIDLAVAAPVCIGPLLLLAIWKNVLEPHAKRKVDRDQYIAAYTDIVLRGLLAPGVEMPWKA